MAAVERRSSSSNSHEAKLMASFDPEEKENVGSYSSGTEVTKYPIKRLELSIRKFVKVLDIDLDRLFKHTANIARLTNAEDWNGLHKEQVNASRTIQQIKANIKEIEKARNQVKDDDLHEFDSKVQEVKGKALAAMEEFMIFAGMQQIPVPQASDTGQTTSPSRLLRNGSQKANIQPVIFDDVDSEDLSQTPYGSLPATLTTVPAPFLTTNLHVVPQNSDASASWEQLQENIVELNEMVHEFAEQVEQQGEAVDRIDENIETAQLNIKEGTSHLAKAAKYKSALLPVVGAVVGGVVAGPIGLVAGVKLGGLAGAVGGAVGFAGGRFVKKRQDKISQMEMSNLSDQRSVSLPDLPLDEKKAQPVASSQAQKKEDSGSKAKEESEAGEKEQEEEDVFTTMTTSFKRFFSFSDDR